MGRHYGITWLFLAALGVSPSADGQIWAEIDDAGTLPGTSQRTRGAGILDYVLGDTSADDVVDMYCIQITDPINFSAWTDASGGGSAEFDTMLWLFENLKSDSPRRGDRRCRPSSTNRP